eukprot:6182512-Pleurochrysis_carterae.AAC.1
MAPLKTGSTVVSSASATAVVATVFAAAGPSLPPSPLRLQRPSFLFLTSTSMTAYFPPIVALALAEYVPSSWSSTSPRIGLRCSPAATGKSLRRMLKTKRSPPLMRSLPYASRACAGKQRQARAP